MPIFRHAQKKNDIISVETINIFKSATIPMDFVEFFPILLKRLKERGSASGGEEMLRLRAHEKIEFLVETGILIKRKTKISIKIAEPA